MLVMRRRTDETIVIRSGPDEVTMTILGIDQEPGRSPVVRVSFEAPQSIPIDRLEIRQKKLLAKSSAKDA